MDEWVCHVLLSLMRSYFFEFFDYLKVFHVLCVFIWFTSDVPHLPQLFPLLPVNIYSPVSLCSLPDCCVLSCLTLQSLHSSCSFRVCKILDCFLTLPFDRPMDLALRFVPLPQQLLNILLKILIAES